MSMRRRAKVGAAVLAMAVQQAAGPAALAAPPRSPAPKPPSDLDEAPLLETGWRQILMAPRITGNLRAIAVDPSNPKEIFVGTEEGTLVHSADGGVTWDEIELTPFLLQSPTYRLGLRGDDYKAIDVFAGFNVRVGAEFYSGSPLYRRTATVAPPVVGPRLDPLPPYFVYPVRIGSIPETLLDAVARSDPKPYEEIRRIRVCPGGANRLFVTTASGRLWGSPDDVTFVPLFLAREGTGLGEVVCSPTNPNEVLLASDEGTFRSTDGGGTFEPIAGALSGAGSSAIAYGAPGEGGKTQLYVATGGDLWIGDSDRPDALRSVTVGSEGEIRHIAASAHAVWVATDTGVRVSRDGGGTWIAIDDLEGFAWSMIAVAPAAPGGTDHVAVMREDIAFESVDGGKVVRPFYRAESRRRLRQIAASPGAAGFPPRFLLVTSGELWASNVSDQGAGAVSEEIRRWARQRLAKMPTQAETIERALAKAHLTDVQVDAMYTGLKTRGYLPAIKVNVSVSTTYTARGQTASISSPARTEVTDANRVWGMLVDFAWELPDLIAPSYDYTPARKDLYEVRKRLEYVIEDAYDERKQILAQLTTTALDAEQLLTLQSRLEVLDVVLQELTTDSPRR